MLFRPVAAVATSQSVDAELESSGSDPEVHVFALESSGSDPEVHVFASELSGDSAKVKIAGQDKVRGRQGPNDSIGVNSKKVFCTAM